MPCHSQNKQTVSLLCVNGCGCVTQLESCKPYGSVGTGMDAEQNGNADAWKAAPGWRTSLCTYRRCIAAVCLYHVLTACGFVELKGW